MSDGIKDAEGQLNSLAGRMGKIGAGMTIGVTAPIVAAGAAAVKMAMDWESAFTGVTKTVDGTAEQIAGLEAELRSMATTGVLSSLENAHVELAGIAEAAGQLGVGVENVAEFTEVVGMLAMTTDIAGESGAQMIAQFANVAGMPLNEVDRFGDVIATLGNNSATTESQILAMGQRLASIADVGFEADEILAYSSALASSGISAELGGTNFMRGVNEIATAVDLGGAALEDIADVAGMTSRQFQQAFEQDAAGAMQSFIEGLSEMSRGQQIQALESIGLTGQEAARVFLTLAGNTELLNDQLNMANEAWAGNNALVDEATKRAETAQGNFNQLKNNLFELGVAFGEVLLPAVNAVVTGLTTVIQWIGQLPGPVKGVIVAILGLVAVVGPLLMFFSGLVTAVTTLAPLLAGVSISFTGIGAVLAVLTGPIGIITIALVALGGILLANREKWGQWANSVSESAQKAGDSAMNFGARMNEGLSNAGIPVNELSKQVESMFMGFIKNFDNLPQMLISAFNLVVQAMTNIGGLIMQGLIQGFIAKGPEFIGVLREWTDNIINTVRNALGIRSPSKVMMEMGVNTVVGFTKGLETFDGISESMLGVPTMNRVVPAMATSSPVMAGAGMGGGVHIENLNVPPGTTQEQIDVIMREIGKRVQNRGAGF